MLSKNLLFLFGAILLPLLFTACDPTCDEVGTIPIPDDDATPPNGTWIVTVLTMTASGPISSLTPYDEDENVITVKNTDEVGVYLMGRDEESGVKYLEMKGGFGFGCFNTAASLALKGSGIIPEVTKNLSPDDSCVFIEESLDVISLGFDFCEAPNAFTEASFGLTGIVHNHRGLEILTTLTINVIP